MPEADYMVDSDLRLDPAFKRAWIAALRSGTFKQTQQRLKTPDGHCCLGVACEIWKETHLDWRWEPGINDDDEGELSDPELGQAFVTDGCQKPNEVYDLPNEIVAEVFHLEEASSDLGSIPLPFIAKHPAFPDRLAYRPLTLVECNDNGCTFDQIADIIEYFL